jgi:hypothetical protein
MASAHELRETQRRRHRHLTGAICIRDLEIEIWHPENGVQNPVPGRHGGQCRPGRTHRDPDSVARFNKHHSNAEERTYNISGLHANSTGISVRWTKRHVEVRILPPQPNSAVSACDVRLRKNSPGFPLLSTVSAGLYGPNF